MRRYKGHRKSAFNFIGHHLEAFKKMIIDNPVPRSKGRSKIPDTNQILSRDCGIVALVSIGIVTGYFFDLAAGLSIMFLPVFLAAWLRIKKWFKSKRVPAFSAKDARSV